MATKKMRGLGRGLDALLGSETATTQATGDVQTTLKVAQMTSGKYQPRSHWDETALASLADSIRNQGLMQPILVRALNGSDQYEIIAGERRWRAAQLAGLTEVPVLVRDVLDENAAIMALIENIQREDLNALEEAQGIERLIKEFSLTHEAAAQAVGRSRTAVSNLLRLLALAKPVQTMLTAGDIDMGHARALLALDNAQQIALANEVVQKHLSVRDTEKRVAQLIKPPSAKTTGAKVKGNDTARLEEILSDALAATVEIKAARGGKGQLVIHYASNETLQSILEKLGVEA